MLRKRRVRKSKTRTAKPEAKSKVALVVLPVSIDTPSEVIKKALFKISAMVLIVGLVLSSFSIFGKTYAYLQDIETSSGNSLVSGTLDLSLASDTNFTPEVTPTATTSRTISVINNGSLNFKYKVKIENTEGNLCDYLEIKDDLADTYLSLESYFSTTTDFTLKKDWVFTAQLTSASSSLQNLYCSFNLVFYGWEEKLDDYSPEGFSDSEEIESAIFTGTWETAPQPPQPPQAGEVVINELMWMGSYGDTNDEWIELKNITSHDIDLSNCVIKNANSGIGPGAHLQIPSGYIIKANDYFLITKKKWDETAVNLTADLPPDKGLTHKSGMNLKNTGEELVLINSSGTTLDTAWKDDVIWPAGNNGIVKQSMERNDIPGDGALAENWHTCVDDQCNDITYWRAEGNNFGTPRAANLSEVIQASEPVINTPTEENEDNGIIQDVSDVDVNEGNGENKNETDNFLLENNLNSEDDIVADIEKQKIEDNNDLEQSQEDNQEQEPTQDTSEQSNPISQDNQLFSDSPPAIIEQ